LPLPGGRDVAAVAPRVVRDADGKRWTCSKRAQYAVAKAPPTLDPLAASDTRFDPASMSVEEVAEALRPVTEIDGFECSGEPDLELAHRLQTDPSAGRSRGTPGSEPNGSPVPHNKVACCGNDGRFLYNNGWNDATLLSEVGCTAWFVHQSVAITSAHCIYDTLYNQFKLITENGVDRAPRWRIAVNGAGPYVTPNCMRIVIPGAWVDAPIDNVAHDYAFIDFSTNGSPCSNPQPAPRWLGTWVATDGEINSTNPSFRWGYPGFVNTSGGAINGPGLTAQHTFGGANNVINANSWAFLNWTGGLSVPPSGTTVSHSNDASPGDSGSPNLKFITDVGWLVVSIHSGGTSTGLQDRRWDWNVLNWVAAYSPY
jgi:V8-like Glu-specific endopeptidase